jgi:hypothetical protein
MRKSLTALLATSMICGAPAMGWAQQAAPAAPAPAPTVVTALAYPNAPGPDAAAVTPPPAPAEPKAEEKEKPGLVESLSGTVGGVLGSAAGASGGPLGSAAAGMVGNKVGRGIGGFFSRLFGGGKKKAVEAPVQATTAESVAQPASAQAPADPIGEVLDKQAPATPGR